jgi:D-alanyl-lipoteichoic acid acyltransferase DltB (MBOAT superfamily)
VGRGVSLLLGIELAPNFRMPYLAEGPSDYWRRWNFTFSRWVRDNVFFPVLARTRKGGLATAAAFAFVFLWLGPNRSSLIFALTFGVLIAVEGRRASWGIPRAAAVFLQFHLSCALAMLTAGVFYSVPIRLHAAKAALFTGWDAAVVLCGIGAVIALDATGLTEKGRTLWRALLALALCFAAAFLFRMNSYMFYYI